MTTQQQAHQLGEPLLLADVAQEEPQWLQLARQEAVARFNELGMPTTRNEDWKYTSLRPLLEAGIEFKKIRSATVTKTIVEEYQLLNSPELLLVFVDGCYQAELSSIHTVQGLTIDRFTAASALDDRLTVAFNALAGVDDDAFVAMNTALFSDGVIVHVARNASVDLPIRILNITSEHAANAAISARNLIVVEPGASATVIEDYVSCEDTTHLTNAVTEVMVGESADVHHYYLARENDHAFNFSTLKIHQADRSKFTSHNVLLNGRIVRNRINPIIDGEHVQSVLNGIYIGRGEQHLDNLMRVEHRKPNCDSRQYYKGILCDQSRGVFTGRIIVSQDAQKTDAVQSNENLLLSPDAQAQTRPQLEIYADDVKCTHGATIGELDDDALFYFRSRGLDETTAKSLLVYAFACESIDRIEHEELRTVIRSLMLRKLPNMTSLEDIGAM